MFKTLRSVKNLSLTVAFIALQFAAPIMPFIKAAQVSAASVCVSDTAGANDEPGQKDLTRLCIDEANLPTSVQAIWNWDELGTNGANTLDGCALFDSNGDGNINYAACVTTNNNPATFTSLTLYSCGDAKPDRCTTPATALTGPYASSCTVNQQATQPFATGTGTPNDTVATCTIVLADFGAANIELVDVCSYPSQQPNSDPSDCVIIQDKSGKLEVIKNLVPANNTGLFNLQVDGTTKATNVGNNGTTGEVIVTEGNHIVGETAGTNTSLASYSTSIECRDLNGTGNVIASGTGTSLANIPIADGADVICIITNTAAGSVTIIKDATPNSLQNFGFTTTGTGLSDFALDDDSGVAGADNTFSDTQTFNGLGAGAYTITESATSGWDLTGINCGNATGVIVNGSAITINLTAGQNVTCTFSNQQRSSISGTKFTADANGTLGAVLGGWTIFIDSNNNGVLDINEPSTITDTNGDFSFTDLSPGTYDLAEVIQNGWTQIFGPAQFLLAAGENTTDKDFGNFQNGSISGLKFNDINGNGTQDNGEPTLSGWTITLFNDGNDLDTDLDDVVTSTQTDVNGAYSFTDLAPDTYAVCETQQAGWTQTFPANNACHIVVIDQSGKSNTADFGNQGRATITVIKDVDTDGDGIVDQTDVTTWTWDIDNAGNFATGSNNPQNVAAGSYTVSEDQQTGYHVTSIICGRVVQPISTSVNVTVNAGDQITCTFTNTRDTGTITVVKELEPANDPGLFDLSVGATVVRTDASDGDSGSLDVVTGDYTVSEAAGTNTSLGNYTTTYVCVDGNVTIAQGSGTSAQVSVTQGDQQITCTFTNARQAKIIVIKDADPDDAQDFTFVIQTGIPEDVEDVGDECPFCVDDWEEVQNPAFSTSFDLDDDNDPTLSNQQTTFVEPGIYTISELEVDDWGIDEVVCNDVKMNRHNDTVGILIAQGETITCTFINEKNQGGGGPISNPGSIKVVKNVDTDGDGDIDLFGATSWTWDIDGIGNFATGTTQAISAGQHIIREHQKSGFQIVSVVCTDEAGPVGLESVSITVSDGEDVVCTFINKKTPTPVVLGDTKQPGIPSVLPDTGQLFGAGQQLSLGITMLFAGLVTLVRPAGKRQ